MDEILEFVNLKIVITFATLKEILTGGFRKPWSRLCIEMAHAPRIK